MCGVGKKDFLPLPMEKPAEPYKTLGGRHPIGKGFNQVSRVSSLPLRELISVSIS